MNSIIFPEIPIKYLDLSVRTLNCLKYKGIKTFSELKELSDFELIRIPNMGKKSLNEINSLILNFNINNFFDANKNLLSILNAPDISSLESLVDLDSVTIESLLLSQRCLNALKVNNIHSVGKLVTLDELDLVKLPNLGRKSLEEITKALLDLKVKLTKFKTNDTLNTNIAEALDKLFDGINKERSEVLKKRLFQNYTLEQCAELLGITRERVRQIEVKFFRKLYSRIGTTYALEVKDYMQNKTGITGFLEMEEVGASFKNISKYLYSASNPKVFLGNIFKKNEILRWQKKNEEFYFFQYESNSLDDLVNGDSIMQFIDASSSDSLYEAIQVYCIINKQSDNFDYIFNKIKKRLSSTDSFAVINAVKQLKKTFTNISMNQIIEFIKSNFDKDLTGKERTLNNVLGLKEIIDLKLYFISGGDYFFLDKINLSKSSINLCAEIAIAFMRKNPHKNYRAHNVYEAVIQNNSFQKIPIKEQNSLNGDVLNAILKEQEGYVDNLAYTGRSTWSVKENLIENNRTEISPAVKKILITQGGPMTIHDIKLNLTKTRGLSKSFQLHTTQSQNELVLVSEGMWGLRNRDLDVTPGEEVRLVDLISKSFKEGNKILDFYDIQKFKEDLNINKGVSVYKLMRMLFRHLPTGRRRTPEKLIFLIKIERKNPLNFCIYSPDIGDDEAKEYLDLKVKEEFVDVRNNEDSAISAKRKRGHSL